MRIKIAYRHNSNHVQKASPEFSNQNQRTYRVHSRNKRQKYADYSSSTDYINPSSHYKNEEQHGNDANGECRNCLKQNARCFLNQDYTKSRLLSFADFLPYFLSFTRKNLFFAPKNNINFVFARKNILSRVTPF